MTDNLQPTSDAAMENRRRTRPVAGLFRRSVLALAIAGAAIAGAGAAAPWAGGHLAAPAHSAQSATHLEGPGGGC